MYPNRINFEWGTDEAIKEVITRDPWPPKEERNQRLEQCLELIRKLLNGDEVSYEGLVRVDHIMHQRREKRKQATSRGIWCL